MDFSLIKYDGKAVTLAWATTKNATTVEHSLESSEQPRPELGKALDAFVPLLLKICELPEAYGTDLKVTSISISKAKKSGLPGIVITARREVTAANAPLILHTPHIQATEDGFALEGLDDALDEAEMEAAKFASGKRGQAEMFSDEETTPTTPPATKKRGKLAGV